MTNKKTRDLREHLKALLEKDFGFIESQFYDALIQQHKYLRELQKRAEKIKKELEKND